MFEQTDGGMCGGPQQSEEGNKSSPLFFYGNPFPPGCVLLEEATGVFLRSEEGKLCSEADAALCRYESKNSV